jgi:7-carboxy-7-deazaguanine synthase
MFGKNAVSSPFRSSLSLMVNSIFATIQGEGPDAGVPAIFVRLSKCNLRCYFCDTEFETGEVMGFQYVMDAIVKEAKPYPKMDLVVITGGEPLLQNINPLVELCNKAGFRVSVETAGTTFYPELVELFPSMSNKIICSPKTPGLNRDIVPLISAFKYIIRAGETSDDDGLPVKSTQTAGVGTKIYRGKDVPIYVQPCDEQDDAANRWNINAAVYIAMKYGYILSIQTHKIAGVP